MEVKLSIFKFFRKIFKIVKPIEINKIDRAKFLIINLEKMFEALKVWIDLYIRIKTIIKRPSIGENKSDLPVADIEQRIITALNKEIVFKFWNEKLFFSIQASIITTKHKLKNLTELSKSFLEK